MCWHKNYVGLPFKPREFDCGVLVERVQREVFGRAIVFPHERGLSVRDWGQQILSLLDDYVELTASPVEGDLVLTSCKGGTHWHVGVYFVDGGEAWMLHNFLDFKQVVNTRLRHLEREGLMLEGVYSWKL